MSECEGRLGSSDSVLSVRIGPASDPANHVIVVPVFTWIVDGAIGLWRADVHFDRPGPWQVTVVPEFGAPLDPVQFLVLPETKAPNIGDVAPAPATPTLADTAIDALTSDSDPERRFYQLSLDEAIGNGKTTVVVFATPAFCRTAACSPLLRVTKKIADEFPGVQFVHIEIYTGLTEPDFVPDSTFLAPAIGADQWNLPSEPWVFVVDGAGIVQARFEGVMGPEELRSALN
ncbi:MAG: hypothetical protein QGD89_01370 [Actinomycetota bacterium]|nr:hypothetical protein [Actinomycetota bacterium]